jgi:hypothetical protein
MVFPERTRERREWNGMMEGTYLNSASRADHVDPAHRVVFYIIFPLATERAFGRGRARLHSRKLFPFSFSLLPSIFSGMRFLVFLDLSPLVRRDRAIIIVLSFYSVSYCLRQ